MLEDHPLPHKRVLQQITKLPANILVNFAHGTLRRPLAALWDGPVVGWQESMIGKTLKCRKTSTRSRRIDIDARRFLKPVFDEMRRYSTPIAYRLAHIQAGTSVPENIYPGSSANVFIAPGVESALLGRSPPTFAFLGMPTSTPKCFSAELISRDSRGERLRGE